MNFFEHQDAARRQSKRLYVMFAMAILGLTLAIYAAFAVASVMFEPQRHAEAGGFAGFQLGLFVACGLGTLGIIGLGAFVKTRSLAAGGSAVAASIGGRLVSSNTSDPMERRLLNVVEEMAIASGVPVPSVFVLDNELGINAFAAGYDLGDAAVAVTKGALHIFNRDELQAVIAHEFSHILNGDMRINIRLIGMLFGIMMIGSTGSWIVRASLSSRSRDKGAPQLALVGIVVWIVGSLGLFFGKLIQRAISRQREFLADASAVQFTRNASGMASALKKIGGYGHHGRVQAREAAEIGHMFFSEALSNTFGGLFATHPPLEERVRRVDPSFDGSFVSVEAPRSLESPSAPATGARRGSRAHASPLVAGVAPYAPASPLANAVRTPTPSPTTKGPIRVDAGEPSVSDHVATLSESHIAHGAELIAAIPDPLRVATRAPFSAVGLLYALLIDDNPAVARKQLATLSTLTHPDILRETTQLAELCRGLDPRLRLPIVELSVPALRQLSPAQYDALHHELTALIVADDHMSLFEFAIRKCVVHWLDSSFGRRGAVPVQFHAIRPLRDQVSMLLSALARFGHDQEFVAAAAFQSAVRGIPMLNPDDIPFLPAAACTFEALDDALERFAAASPIIKARVLDACARCVIADGAVTPAEADLLRVVADAMDCPLPPFLADGIVTE